MLIEFTVSNFRSIADKQIVSLVPDKKINDLPQNIVERHKYQALNVVAMYGPNNSGKSTILQGLHLLIHLLRSSSASNSSEELPYEPNLLVSGYSDRPTELSMVFVYDGARYRYGLSFNQKSILTEWLYRKKVGREVALFVREGDIIDVTSALEGGKKVIDAAIEATRDNGLFLSTGDILNLKDCGIIFKYIDSLLIIDGVNSDFQGRVTENRLEENPDFISHINRYITSFDLGIHRIFLAESKDGGAPVVCATHLVFDENGKETGDEIAWALADRESSGTQKMFQIIGPVISTLSMGSTIVIDEIEAKLHTQLTNVLVSLFTDPKSNPKQAQLIFATHDTNLLSYANLRRDQINFVEKDKKGSTQIFALSDVRYFAGNKERPDKNREEKSYLEGRYGATPKVKFEDLLIPVA
ncbi:MAG: ATP/GTP-binding protein [Lewinella sp.]